MPAYHFHPTLLLRTPIFSYRYYSETDLAEVLKQPIFRKAIYFSSEVFYRELEKANFNLNKLDKKAIDTLKKYFNRMCFRPTPFGICSAFGALYWADSQTKIKISKDNLTPNIQLSYAKSIEFADTLINEWPDRLLYKLNPAIYKAGNEYRFIRSILNNAQTEFIIDSIKSDSFFKKLLPYLSSWRTITEVCDYTCRQTGCSNSDANIYVAWLVDSQILSKQTDPNITGQDYLERLLDKHPKKSIRTVFDLAKNVRSIDDLENIPDAENTLSSKDFYLNLESKLPGTELSSRYQQGIRDALNCLNLFSDTSEPTGLAEFKKAFLNRFDGQTIPLLAALDPEIGVGYGNLAIEDTDINIAQNIIEPPVSENRPIPWNNIHALLFKKWKTSATKTTPIVLTEDDLKDIAKETVTCPNTASVMFRIVDDKVLIETAGGVTASALIGRFTPFNTTIKQLAIDMAAKETLYNPEIIFAEIAHICHDKTANIDRREHIYEYEIPVLVQSTREPEQQIVLSDLWVSVTDGKIILQSKRLGKRIIPRLSSAFNYTRNDLAVFRFLCDLQKSDIKANMGINLSQYFPGLDYYPRLEYKNTILQLAYWNIKKQVFADVFKVSVDNKITSFNSVRSNLQLPACIAFTQADHQLVFNLDDENDILFFLDVIKNSNQITVKEHLLPSTLNPIVINQNGQGQVNQFITSIYHEKQVYLPHSNKIFEAKTNQRRFNPGTQWLYLKLYCHPARSNELLTDVIRKTLRNIDKNKLISEWFFIRYADPDYHIRLRLKVEPQKHQQVLEHLSLSLKLYINNGLINNYVIDTYQRELERYSHRYMAQFEHAFYTSSNFVAEFLNHHGGVITTQQMLQFAIVSVNDLLISLGIEGKAMINFLDAMFTSFSNEFKLIDDLKYQLDIEYRKQKMVIEIVRKKETVYYNDLNLNKARKLFIQSLSHLKASIIPKDSWKDKWVADLVHMHLNRLFINDWRKQEMMIYYFSLKYERSVQARQQTNNIPVN